jgi:hypothetical protein
LLRESGAADNEATMQCGDPHQHANRRQIRSIHKVLLLGLVSSML